MYAINVFVDYIFDFRQSFWNEIFVQDLLSHLIAFHFLPKLNVKTGCLFTCI